MKVKVGDRLYLPWHGVGTVQKVGAVVPICEVQLADGRRFAVPVPQLEARGIRPLIHPHHVSIVYRYLGDPAAPARWDERERIHRIQTGDPLQLVAVLRDLASRRATHTPEEREQYELARGLLAQEIAAVQGVEVATVIEEIEARLR